MQVKAYAKINLSLDIVAKRGDGYHELSTVMHTVDLFDVVDIEKAPSGISVATDLPYVAKGEDNIAYKAADAFFWLTKIDAGVTIDIKKSIPVGGGLGGSSADGAAVLVGLNELFEKPLTDEELLRIGAALGADVPFCIKKGCALCEGIGERMTPLPSLTDLYAVIIKPRVFCSTKKMYAAYDALGTPPKHSTPGMVDAIVRGDKDAVCSFLSNAFEAVCLGQYPEIAQCKDLLLSLGAKSAVLSGSGACVFGLFDNEASANTIAQKLYDKEVYVVKLI